MNGNIGAIPTWSSHLHSQEVDVAVWFHPAPWTRPGDGRHLEYRFHCLGHLTPKNKATGLWTLELAQANRRDPGMYHSDVAKYMEQSFCAAVRDVLERTLGKTVKPIDKGLFLWAEVDKPEGQPCPYRHAVEAGYWPVQRLLFHLPTVRA